jgi:sugar lactone lactonase YvrE
MDSRGTLYVTAPELDGIVVVGQDRTPRLLAKDPRLAWPDGVALSADEGWLYVTCSQLHDVMGEDPGDIAAGGPFRILRIRLPAP